MPVLSYRLCSVVVAYPSVAAWSDPSFLHVANYKAFCCLPMLKVQMKQVQNNKQFVSNKSCRRGLIFDFEWICLLHVFQHITTYMFFFLFSIIFYLCYFLPFIFFLWWSRRYAASPALWDICVPVIGSYSVQAAIVHPILILLRLDTHQVGPCK